MIILHSSTPSSLLKAAILCKVTAGTCRHNSELPLSVESEVTDCEAVSLQNTVAQYEATFGPLPWLGTGKSRQLSGAVYYAARFRGKDRYGIIIDTLMQALEHGPDYVLSRVSKEAREMMSRSRRVSMELHRAFGFIRLNPVNSHPGVMFGKVTLEHDTYDLVIKYFSRRFRGERIFLIDGETAYFMEGNNLKTTRTELLPFDTSENDFAELWDAYYDSQFIEGRKNLALAKKHVPKKVWSWVDEGKKLK